MTRAVATAPHTERMVARTLAETPDPGDALARALRTIGESLGWRLGTLWEPAADWPAALRCVAAWRAGGVDASEFVDTSGRTLLAAGEGLPGRVWRTGEPAWMDDLLSDDNPPRVAAARRAGLHAAVCFPVRSARGVIGAIEFFTGDAQQPDPDLLATLAALGDQLGQAVERRRDTEALHAAQARHRAMVEAALDCVVTIDHRGRILDFNPVAERCFGYRAADVVGREMAEVIVPPELRERHRRGLGRHLATNETTVLGRRVETLGMRADGTVFPVELAITRIEIPGPPTFAGYLRDISDRKAAEAPQRLGELARHLRTARARVYDDPREAGELIDAAFDQLAAATGELRELARGVAEPRQQPTA